MAFKFLKYYTTPIVMDVYKMYTKRITLDAHCTRRTASILEESCTMNRNDKVSNVVILLCDPLSRYRPSKENSGSIFEI